MDTLGIDVAPACDACKRLEAECLVCRDERRKRFMIKLMGAKFSAAAHELEERDSNLCFLHQVEMEFLRYWLKFRGLELVADREGGWRVGRLSDA